MGSIKKLMENLREGTEKQGDYWVNKDKSGRTYGKFKTKKRADDQRKAMFANKKMTESFGDMPVVIKDIDGGSLEVGRNLDGVVFINDCIAIEVDKDDEKVKKALENRDYDWLAGELDHELQGVVEGSFIREVDGKLYLIALIPGGKYEVGSFYCVDEGDYCSIEAKDLASVGGDWDIACKGLWSGEDIEEVPAEDIKINDEIIVNTDGWNRKVVVGAIGNDEDKILIGYDGDMHAYDRGEKIRKIM